MAFLQANGLGAAKRRPVAGDASTRAYERLKIDGRPALIFMDAPPAAESGVAGPEASSEQRIAMGYNAMARLSASRVDAFVAVADWLRGRGLSAPDVVAFDADKGFAVLEDLGDDLFVNRLAAGEDPFEVYGAATDLLVALHAEPPPASLPVRGDGAWPLLPYDALALKTGVDLFLDWWPKFAAIPAPNEAAQAEWLALWAPVLAAGETGAAVFTHRDYHAENLLWLPDRRGAARVGLLDFQDAVRGHPAWDLIHLLQDARRDVAPEVEAAMIERYLATRPDLDPAKFRADYAALGALNAARILGPGLRPAGLCLRPRQVSSLHAPHLAGPGEEPRSPRHGRTEWLVRPPHPSGRAGVSVPKTAMVLAAGLGTRMRPLTDDRPKALVEVAGKPLIDHMLDRLTQSGVERAIVNAHAHADRLIAHLQRREGGLAIFISDERSHALPLETGGGIKAAADLLGDAPILVANIDSVWREDAEPPARAIINLCEGFDPARASARLLLARMERTLGFDGPGDFFMDGEGRLEGRRVSGAASAPYNYMGVHIVDPRPIYAASETAFGLFPGGAGLWGGWAAGGRLHGALMEGDWMHVGDPAARDAAEAKLGGAKRTSASDAH